MTDQVTDFTGRVKMKIAERRRGLSAIATETETYEERIARRIAPLDRAVREMTGRLSADQVFAQLVGKDPDVRYRASSSGGEVIAVSFDGQAGAFRFIQAPVPDYTASQTRTAERVWFRIAPNTYLRRELGWADTYAPGTAVEGSTDDLAGVIDRAEDLIAEFCADVCTSPAAAHYGVQERF